MGCDILNIGLKFSIIYVQPQNFTTDDYNNGINIEHTIDVGTMLLETRIM